MTKGTMFQWWKMTKIKRSNVEHGDKLFKLLHDNNDYSDIDEIIEE